MTSKKLNSNDLATNVHESLIAFRKNISSLSKKQLERILIASVEHPVERTVKIQPGIESATLGLANHIKETMVALTFATAQEQGEQNEQEG